MLWRPRLVDAVCDVDLHHRPRNLQSRFVSPHQRSLDNILNKTNHIVLIFLASLSMGVQDIPNDNDADKCHNELKDVDHEISHKFDIL